MKLLIDNADIRKIEEAYSIFPLEGVTTNPTILAAAGRPPFEVLKEIREFIGTQGALHVQVVAKEAEGILSDADRILDELGANTYVKVPVTREGLKAMKSLKRQGVRITATAIYTPMQAYLAGEAGAEYAAPYVNRIDNLGAGGIRSAGMMHEIFVRNNMHVHVLAASFKNSQQVLALCAQGVGAATVAPDILFGLIRNDSVERAVDAFTTDFEKLCGTGKTMSSL